MPTTSQTVRRLALDLPEVREGVCFGTPAWYVRKKLMLRMWEDDETLVAKMAFPEREKRLAEQPDTFLLTDHYRNYPCVLVSLSAIDGETLRRVIDEAWRFVAPPKLVQAREARVSDLTQSHEGTKRKKS